MMMMTMTMKEERIQRERGDIPNEGKVAAILVVLLELGPLALFHRLGNGL